MTYQAQFPPKAEDYIKTARRIINRSESEGLTATIDALCDDIYSRFERINKYYCRDPNPEFITTLKDAINTTCQLSNSNHVESNLKTLTNLHMLISAYIFERSEYITDIKSFLDRIFNSKYAKDHHSEPQELLTMFYANIIITDIYNVTEQSTIFEQFSKYFTNLSRVFAEPQLLNNILKNISSDKKISWDEADKSFDATELLWKKYGNNAFDRSWELNRDANNHWDQLTDSDKIDTLFRVKFSYLLHASDDLFNIPFDLRAKIIYVILKSQNLEYTNTRIQKTTEGSDDRKNLENKYTSEKNDLQKILDDSFFDAIYRDSKVLNHLIRLEKLECTIIYDNNQKHTRELNVVKGVQVAFEQVNKRNESNLLLINRYLWNDLHKISLEKEGKEQIMLYINKNISKKSESLRNEKLLYDCFKNINDVDNKDKEKIINETNEKISQKADHTNNLLYGSIEEKLQIVETSNSDNPVYLMLRELIRQIFIKSFDPALLDKY